MWCIHISSSLQGCGGPCWPELCSPRNIWLSPKFIARCSTPVKCIPRVTFFISEIHALVLAHFANTKEPSRFISTASSAKSLIPAIDHIRSRSTGGEGLGYFIKPHGSSYATHVDACDQTCSKKLMGEIGVLGPSNESKPGISERYEDHFIIQMHRWWDSDIFVWSVRLCCIGLSSGLRTGWGMTGQVCSILESTMGKAHKANKK